MNLARFFIDRPIFAAVLSLVFVVAGALSLFVLPVSEHPQVVPPTVIVQATYPGANPRIIAETVASPLEQQINGVEDMLYMFSQATSDGRMTLDRHLRARHRSRQAQVRRPEPWRRRCACPRRCSASASSPRRTRRTSSWSCTSSRRTSATTCSTCRTSPTCRCATSCAIRGVGNAQVFGAGEYACECGWIRTGSHRASSRPATSCARFASRTSRSPPACWADRRRRPTRRSRCR